jgi:hypothetical protein
MKTEMKDFKTLKLIFERNTKISSRVVDGFLLYYAAERDHLEFQMNRRFEVYKHITNKFPEELTNRLKAQYIAHRIFKEDGLITDYLRHTALLNLDKKERNWLEIQAKQAWKFSFSQIKDCPAENFYIMKDAFSEEEYLLYSPGVTKTLEDQSIILWFNLLSFNGFCWQSYGPIGAYKSFEPEDVFFFGGEVNIEIVSKEEFLDDLDCNPVPYMMLLSGAYSPLIYNKEDQLVHVWAEYYPESFNIKEISGMFKTEYKKGVCRLSLNNWSESPHWAHVYFDEEKEILRFTSLTERGYRAFLKEINKFGYNFPEKIFIRVNLSMMIIASDILKREIELNEYEGLFSEETSPGEKENLAKFNTLLRLVLPDINSGRKPDIEILAKKAGVDVDTAKDLIEQIIGRLNKMDSQKKKKFR